MGSLAVPDQAGDNKRQRAVARFWASIDSTPPEPVVTAAELLTRLEGRLGTLDEDDWVSGNPSGSRPERAAFMM